MKNFGVPVGTAVEWLIFEIGVVLPVERDVMVLPGIHIGGQRVFALIDRVQSLVRSSSDFR